MDTNQKENDFIIQNGKLSPAALKRKTELENNPASQYRPHGISAGHGADFLRYP